LISFFIALNVCLCYNYYGDIMLITKIEKLKNNKYKLTIDDEKIITFDNVILDNNLLYKKQIDEELYNKIIEDTNFYNIYNMVVKYILKRRRSEKEVSEYLRKYDLNSNKQDILISKLKSINLIDDISFCKAYINDNIYLSKKGINKIKIELLNHNIPLSIIEEEISNIDKNLFDDKLNKLIIKKINTNNKYSNSYLKQKVLNEMINLGYEKDKIIKIIENNLNEDNKILEKEFEKLYIKLSKKYNNLELYKNITSKLLYKGFNIQDIKSLIEKKQKT